MKMNLAGRFSYRFILVILIRTLHHSAGAHKTSDHSKTLDAIKNNEIIRLTSSTTTSTSSGGTISIGRPEGIFPKSSSNHNPNWAFLVVADSHSFTQYSWKKSDDNMRSNSWIKMSKFLTDMKNKYGGELVLLPGDMVSYGRYLTSKMIRLRGTFTTPQEAVYSASMNSGNSTRVLFQEAGYDTVLASIGDHDIGGNEGFQMLRNKRSKISTIPSYRRGFGDGYNRNEQNEFMFDQLFGGIPSRPMGTPYENTTFAYVHKNALFVTVDAFEIVGDGSEDYFDRENGRGGEGAVTCTVSGDHLTWFENMLRYGKDNLEIRHIFVQAHLPIIQPVQRVDTSGQFFDSAEESDFWSIMNEYDVDIYFAGDVHATTATKSRHDGSNLVQIVSRGVTFNNFLTVDISDHIIDVNIYNEYVWGKKSNGQYTKSGRLTIDKSSKVTQLSSSGMLELLDLESEILLYDFEDIFPLGKRQVISMGAKNTIMVKEKMIRDELCTESIFNHGGFGAQYDAQVSNIILVEGRNRGENAALFGESSRFGVYGTGPFSGGEIVSFGMWIKTKEAAKNMVLVHHANYWGSDVGDIESKDHFTLTLDLGVPVIHIQRTIKLKSSDQLNLADEKWHHIAVSMPRKSCKLSELEIYVDGVQINTSPVQYDRPIFHTTTGRMSLGGFGYSQRGFENAYPDVVPYMGLLDDFTLYARSLKMKTDFPSLFNQESSPSPIFVATKQPSPSASDGSRPSTSPSQKRPVSSSSRFITNNPPSVQPTVFQSEAPSSIASSSAARPMLIAIEILVACAALVVATFFS